MALQEETARVLKLLDETIKLSSKVAKLEADNRTLRDDNQALRAEFAEVRARLITLEEAEQAEAVNDAETESEPSTSLRALLDQQIGYNSQNYVGGQPVESEPPHFTNSLYKLDCFIERDDVAEEEPEVASSPSIFSWFWGGRSS
mmetsp:Transcript_50900/g.122711  ORF Transcript_50900/g.122711 Transcript_50900/m.122711 type:complete len:145 (+) Transcript_50900:347-781(+)|eukprot:CAMPEP_0113501902 /NCGR_PEP_ID=MMETSP0014_2-20120614/33226_1 /TAXON_ID=2857 /ORGANISM="Nitzschia sp." /LENGTH=144 /DNA_ID=CAMNT_0000396569 /DNA_START=146 /DNA_END=580 /DNA_ORIENTATION=- /assembly_acc=CAM_ASM_000159